MAESSNAFAEKLGSSNRRWTYPAPPATASDKTTSGLPSRSSLDALMSLGSASRRSAAAIRNASASVLKKPSSLSARSWSVCVSANEGGGTENPIARMSVSNMCPKSNGYFNCSCEHFSPVRGFLWIEFTTFWPTRAKIGAGSAYSHRSHQKYPAPFGPRLTTKSRPATSPTVGVAGAKKVRTPVKSVSA